MLDSAFQLCSRVVALLICTAAAASAMAQIRSDVRPDAGTLLEPQLQRPLLPSQGVVPLRLPDPKPPVLGDASVRMTPGAFNFVGNSVFSNEVLASLVATYVNQSTDLAGLRAAAGSVSAYYRSKGYLLTEAYLPEQAFTATGGTVTIAVIEARVGRVSVMLKDQRLSKAFAEELVAFHLKRGDAATEYSLDKPVLLLRDLAGYDASATIEPGTDVGEADVRVELQARGARVEGVVSVDNYGSAAAGALRAVASVNVNNLLGRGDVLALSGQLGNQSGSSLYRGAYTVPVGPAGTRLGVSAAHLEYALGKQFAALGASGKADILGLNLSQPLVRGRDNNLYAQVSTEQKKLFDQTATPVLRSEKEIVSLLVGLAGNFSDTFAGGAGFNSYGLNATLGRLSLNATDLALDSAFGGLSTAGSFGKFNLDFQRAQYLSSASSVHLRAQAQFASKNLNSAEKFSLGGPYGVRGYPVGDGIGDSGGLFSLEYRYTLAPFTSLLARPVSLLAFYDYGRVRFNQNGPGVPGAPNGVALGSIGIGSVYGSPEGFLIKTHLAWRTTSGLPTTGDADRNPRAWLTAQTAF